MAEPLKPTTAEEREAWFKTIDADHFVYASVRRGAREFTQRLCADVDRLTSALELLQGIGPGLELAYMGGYHDQRDLEIFRHGMATAANVVRTAVAAELKGERPDFQARVALATAEPPPPKENR